MANYFILAACFVLAFGFIGMGAYQIITKKLFGKARYKSYTEESCTELAEKEGICYILTALGVLLVTLSAGNWILPEPLMWGGWLIMFISLFMTNRYAKNILVPIPVTVTRTKKQIKQAKKVSLNDKGTKKKKRK